MKTFEFTIKGLVQGVGYRPFIARLCMARGINGDVRNSGGIVFLRANFAEEKEANEFAVTLAEQYPEGAKPADISFVQVSFVDFTSFEVVKSNRNGLVPHLPADIGICENCLAELRGDQIVPISTNLVPKSTRFNRYPFISCAACGPRASIMRKIPYDRENTTMSEFEMCPECKKEFYDPADRRFYAQTISCPNCGPSLFWWDTNDEEKSELRENRITIKQKDISQEKIFNIATEILKSGGVLAVKNIGGYHLVCDATNSTAVERIRTIKNRETKPFAVMVKDVEIVKTYAHISQREEELLKSPARPIVLLEASNIRISPSVSMSSPDIGIMLPSNGLQYMLAEEFEVLVMTSANISGEPIIADDEAVKKLGVPVLGNDREIINPSDDSVVRIINDRVQILRRGRGYVPESLELGQNNLRENATKTIFASGADMKASFAFFAGNKAYVSQCFGDMSDLAVQTAYEKTSQIMCDMHNISPEVYAYDMHPGYASSSKIRKINANLIPVQHHIAHAASVIAENEISGPALCFSFDGTGYGLDKTIWGGELFYYNDGKFARTGHLDSVRLPGGDEGSRNANLALAGYIYEMRKRGMLGGIADEEIFCYNKLFERDTEKLVYNALKLEINSVLSSSCGRLFDAVSALLGIGAYNHYEGECACELEYAARKYRKVSKDNKDNGVGMPKPKSTMDILEILIRNKREGKDKGYLACLFHKSLVDLMLEMITSFSCGEKQDTKDIVLSGGCFANHLLTEMAIEKFEQEGFKVYTANKLPPGDDGITLGQLFYALNMHEQKTED
ncbi:MAG: carbamoyltransferase HypF [Lachnospiraceae bacterium]|nr:carbamoyltransferase HypF [Lachnospiraceae bacterium]